MGINSELNSEIILQIGQGLEKLWENLKEVHFWLILYDVRKTYAMFDQFYWLMRIAAKWRNLWYTTIRTKNTGLFVPRTDAEVRLKKYDTTIVVDPRNLQLHKQMNV